MRLLPESARLPEWESGPTLCSVLHRKGFILRPDLRRIRWALTPPFHPYLAKARRYIFCDTIRQLGLTPEAARAFARHAAFLVFGLSSADLFEAQQRSPTYPAILNY